jgi:hypothetical protein
MKINTISLVVFHEIYHKMQEYGYYAVLSKDDTEILLYSHPGKHVANIGIKGKRLVATYPDGQKIMTGPINVKTAEELIVKNWYATKIA